MPPKPRLTPEQQAEVKRLMALRRELSLKRLSGYFGVAVRTIQRVAFGEARYAAMRRRDDDVD